MQIIDHKLQGVRFQQSANHGGKLVKPSLLVVHYTAGLSLSSAITTLCDSRMYDPPKGVKPPTKRARRSAHVVVGRSGEVVQLVPFDLVSWHAGESVWRGKTQVNLFSIGIELDNPGWLERVNGRWHAAINHSHSYEPDEVVVAKHRSGGPERGWLKYAPAQLTALDEITAAIVATYSTITDGVGHEDIAPGRKVDPGPAFPMAQWRARHFGGRPEGDGAAA